MKIFKLNIDNDPEKIEYKNKRDIHKIITIVIFELTILILAVTLIIITYMKILYIMVKVLQAKVRNFSHLSQFQI